MSLTEKFETPVTSPSPDGSNTQPSTNSRTPSPQQNTSGTSSTSETSCAVSSDSEVHPRKQRKERKRSMAKRKLSEDYGDEEVIRSRKALSPLKKTRQKAHQVNERHAAKSIQTT